MRGVCLALACLMGGSALAEVGLTPPPRPRVIDTNLPRQDVVFVSDAGVASLGAIALAELALARGSSDVRVVARLVRDVNQHVRDELGRLAVQQGFTLAEQLLPEQRIACDTLRTLSGKDFDRQYLTLVALEEEQALARFANEARDGGDAALRELARTMLPSLRVSDATATATLRRL